jgi:AcrR family transcriptional regulator
MERGHMEDNMVKKIAVSAESSSGASVTDMDAGARRKVDRRRDPIKTREQLIASGMTLFNNPGYFFTDSNQIARHAGFAPGTFYQHFKNKAELFLEVKAIWFDGIKTIIRTGVEQQKTPEGLAEFLTAQLIPQFETWAGLRNSMRALTATEEAAREYRRKNMADMIEVCNVVRRTLGKEPRPKVEALTLIMLLERTADALSGGEFEALGVDRATAAELVKNTILNFLTR